MSITRFFCFFAGFAAGWASFRAWDARSSGSGSGTYSYSGRSRPESQRATLPMLRLTAVSYTHLYNGEYMG